MIGCACAIWHDRNYDAGMGCGCECHAVERLTPDEQADLALIASRRMHAVREAELYGRYAKGVYVDDVRPMVLRSEHEDHETVPVVAPWRMALEVD